MRALAAERIKLTSTKSPLWCTIAVIVLGLGIGAAIAAGANASMSATDPTQRFQPTLSVAVSGVSGFGVLVLMILGALAVTTEYRFGTIRTTFQAIPARTPVLVVKAALIGTFGAALTVVLAFFAYQITKAVAGERAGALLHLSSTQDWRGIYGVAIYAFCAVFLAVGVGALVRQSAAAIAIVLLWPLLFESLFALFGHIGRDIQAFLPFENINHFLGQPSTIEFHWGPWGSLAYFAVICAIVFGASLYATHRRDA